MRKKANVPPPVLVRLYRLSKGDRIEHPPASDGSRYTVFDHLDGMYSYCVTERGNVIHFAASTELFRIRKSVYRLV